MHPLGCVARQRRRWAGEERRGAVLCFPHGEAEESPVHEGSAVDASLGGEKYKYVIRTDVLFAIDK